MFGKQAGRSGNGRPVLLCSPRTDAEKAGVISLVASDADNFKPVEGYAEGEWYATAGSVSFGYPERVAAKDLEWALEEGAKQLNGFEARAA